ncbi:hypothetical protein [Planktotalea sp.]|uniref:hypothetical protein n=1 Tax=Planktotalea sp. TaxID=2029877 RepID=UPI0025F790E2|nr:hypothetical protein [Planktotalea sp.]
MTAKTELPEVLQRDKALQEIIADSEQGEDSDKASELVSGAVTAVEVIGRKRYFDLRDKWSGWIIKWITALIAFNAVITVAVGAGLLDYSEYEWFITAIVVQTFLQIVGLGAIAVRYLFADSGR